MPRPGILWNGQAGGSLPKDGGKWRPSSVGNGKKRLRKAKGLTHIGHTGVVAAADTETAD
jgi:hypothetical protein